MARTAPKPQLYPSRLVERDIRVLVGFGIFQRDQLGVRLTPGVTRSGTDARSLYREAIFEFEDDHLRRFAAIEEEQRILRIEERWIESAEPPEKPRILSGNPGVVRGNRNLFVGAGAAERLGRELQNSRSRFEQELESVRSAQACRPLKVPIVCAVRVFEMRDGTPLLILTDEAKDRVVLAIGNIGRRTIDRRIEWTPDKPEGYRPSWYSQITVLT